MIDEKISRIESQFEDRFTQIESELKEKANQDDLLAIENKVKGLSHANCSNKLAEMQRDIAQLSRQLNDLINEPVDVAHRAKNVIARNVPENSGDGSDVEKVAEVMGAIGISQCPSLTRRLGQASEERNRPVLLRFEKREVATSVLANAKKLAQADQHWLNSVYLDPDRTKIEGLRRKNHIERVEKLAVRMNAVGKDVYRQGTRIFYNSSRPKPQYPNRVSGHPALGMSSRNFSNSVPVAANASRGYGATAAASGKGGCITESTNGVSDSRSGVSDGVIGDMGCTAGVTSGGSGDGAGEGGGACDGTGDGAARLVAGGDTVVA
jgi:hypothetical protein